MGDTRPDPGHAADIAEFVGLLDELRAWAGSPSYRTLAKKAGPLMRPPRVLSQSTLGELFRPRRRRLDADLVVAVVRALGLDATEAAAWHAACVRIHVEAKAGGPTTVLRQLPADLATFTGREADLAWLEHVLDVQGGDTAPTVVISAIEGMGGAGKTQLAVHLAHRFARAGRYADVQLFVNLRGFHADDAPADPCDVLGSFLQALDVPARRIPAGLDERAALFRDRIHGRQTLIVLDNAAGEHQVRSLIPSGPDCLVLITSRRSLAGLDGATSHHLGLFTPTEAVALLARIAGAERVGAEPTAAARIGELCGHLPLAVALAAARLKSRPAWALADLVVAMNEAGLQGLAAGGRDVSAILDLSYRSLPQRAQAAIRLMSLHPGEDLTVDSAAALTGYSPAEAHAVLELLLDEHLLQQTTAGRYQFHDLVRLHGRDLASGDAPTDRSAALTRLMDHYRRVAAAAMDILVPHERDRRPKISEDPCAAPAAFTDAAAAEAWLRAELTNVIQAVDATAPDLGQHASDLSLILYRHLEERGLRRAAFLLHRRAFAAARSLDDPARQADAARHLGTTYWQQGRCQEAADYFRRALIGYRTCENHVGMAATLGNLGLIAGRQGRSAAACNSFRRSRLLFAQLGDPVGESRALNALGNIYRRLGRYEESLDCHDRAIEFGRQAVEQGVALGSRGVTRMRQGDYARALHDLHGARDVLDERGYQFRGELLTDLGNLHTRLNRHEAALTYLMASLAASRAGGDLLAEGWALIGLSELHYTLSDYTEAFDSADQALVLAEAIGEHSIKIHAHNSLGRTDTARGRLDSGAARHRTAFELTRISGDLYQRAKAWDGLAEVHRRREEPVLAAEREELALRVYRKLGTAEARGLLVLNGDRAHRA